MFVVFFFSSWENKDVVKVYYIEYVNVATKGVVNVGLEGGGGIG